MDELRKCWKVPYIVYYYNLFVETFDLVELRIDEFEEALINDTGTETNLLIVHLLQKILKPFIIRTIDLTTFESVLVTVLKRYKKQEQLFPHGKWSELDLQQKINILFELCELRLQLNDVEAKFNELEIESLRMEPLGIDSSNCKLWYFGDLRLYEEKQPPEKISQIEVQQQIPEKAYRKNKYRKPPTQQTPIIVPQSIEYESLEDIQWSCVCITLDDWNELANKYKKSRKKIDQEIYTNLKNNYLNVLPELYQKAEKERQQREQACAPKRVSMRLEEKRLSQVNSGQETDDDMLNVDEISNQTENKKEGLSEDSNTQFSIDSQQKQQEQQLNDFNIRNYFLMQKVLNKILQTKYAWPFKQPVTDEEAPDYGEIVKNPIDLSIIQLKINKKVYKSRNEFVHDLELVASNCKSYNGADSFYGKIATKLEDLTKRFLKSLYNQEISNSLEEKNRLLKKLNNADDINNNDDSLENYNDDTMLGAPSEANQSQLEEGEYITKTTSRGRIIKMKVNQDFTEYQSDNETSGKRKKRQGSKEDNEKYDINSSDSDSDDDELKKIKRRVLTQNNHIDPQVPRRGRGRPRKYPRKEDLCETIGTNDDDESVASSNLSFDQYVKMLDKTRNITSNTQKNISLKVPVLNPAIKVVLAQNKVKISQKPIQQIDSQNDDSLFNLSNIETLNNSVKMIALPQQNSQVTPQQITQQKPPQIIKIVNLSDINKQGNTLNKTPILTKANQVVVLNTSTPNSKTILNGKILTPVTYISKVAPLNTTQNIPNQSPVTTIKNTSILSNIIFNSTKPNNSLMNDL